MDCKMYLSEPFIYLNLVGTLDIKIFAVEMKVI